MRFVEIEYMDGRIIFIRPCPRSHLPSVQVLINRLYERWLEFKLSAEEVIKDQGCWQLMQDVAALFPRLNHPGQMGFDLEAIGKEDVEQLESLFLAQRIDGQFKLCKLGELITFEPLPLPQWQTAKEDAPPPIPSSGDPEMDLLASFTAALDWNQAWSMYHNLDAEGIDRFLHQLAEHRRDPEERKMEGLAQDYAAWKTENQDTLRETLGIKFKRPVEAEVSG